MKIKLKICFLVPLSRDLFDPDIIEKTISMKLVKALITSPNLQPSIKEREWRLISSES